MDPEELARQAEEDLNTVIVEPETPEPDDDDDDDELDDAAPAPQPENAKSRKQKRASGYRELKETNERITRELQETRMAQSRMEGLLQANMRPQQQGPHPAVLEVEEAMREQDEFYKAFSAQAATMSEAQREQAGNRARQLEVKKGLAMARLANAQAGIGQAPNQDQIRQVAFNEQLRQTFPDIAADERAATLGGHIARAMFAEGKPQNWDTLHEAAEETRRRLGMPSTRKQPKPTEVQKSKFVSAPKGAAAGASGEAKPLRITKKQAQMAENAYPGLPAGKAHQKWWNEVGKKYA